MQGQVTDTFDELWNSLYSPGDYSSRDMGTNNDNGKILSWSDGQVTNWIDEAVKNKSSLTILDAGCGGGYGFKSIMELNINSLSRLDHIEYVGVDLINLDRTKENIQLFSNLALPNTRLSVRLLNADMTTISLEEQFDIVMALGSLHHTSSVSLALNATYQKLRPSGLYIGWVINQQKPLRAYTDTFFREFYNDCPEDRRDRDLTMLSLIFNELGEALGNKNVCLTHHVSCLDLEPGTYKLQTLLYDYFFKCYFQSGDSREGLKRIKAQLYDWFVPTFYHQTSRDELKRMIEKLHASSQLEVITQTNGHFFKFIKKS